MVETNKLSAEFVQGLKNIGDTAIKRIKELKPEIPTTGKTAEELAQVPTDLDLSGIPPKDIVSFTTEAADGTLRSHVLPNNYDRNINVLLGPNSVGKKILGDEPLRGVVAQDFNTLISSTTDATGKRVDIIKGNTPGTRIEATYDANKNLVSSIQIGPDGEKKVLFRSTEKVEDFPPAPETVNNFL